MNQLVYITVATYVTFAAVINTYLAIKYWRGLFR